MKRALVCVVTALALLVMFSALANAASETKGAVPKRGGKLVSAISWDPPHWDPQMTLSYQVHSLTSFVYSKLTRDKQGEAVDPYVFILEPDLAHKWEVLGPTEIVFSLRKGVKFQNKPPVNGREVTAADVKYSFERTLSESLKSPNRSFYEKIKSIEAPDPYTVKLIMSEPFAPILKYTALTFAPVIPKEAVEKYGDLKQWQSIVGSGPFVLDNYEPNVKVEYSRNPDYFEEDKPYLDKVELRIIKSPEVALAAMRSKELDLGGTSDYESLEGLLKVHPDLKWMEWHNNNWPRVTLACDKPPFNDKRVRHAVSLSFDREAQLMSAAGGRGWVDSVLTIGQWGSLPIDQLGESSRLYKPNIEEAKRLLREAGYKPPVKIKIAYSPVYGTYFVSMVEVFAGQMNSAGAFQVELVPKEYGAYISSTYLGKYDEDGLYALSTPPADPDDILWTLFHSTAARNSARIKDPKVDELLEKQRQEMDEAKRLEILKEIQLYLADQMYHVPTTLPALFDCWFPYVRGYARHSVPWYNWGDRYRLVWLDK